MSVPKPLLLVILDGFGISLQKDGNPVEAAKKPNLDEIEQNFPFTILQASGVAVGLPWGEAGNSEVGHLTMGAGRVIYHHLPRIIYSIYDGSFFKNEAFRKAAEHVRKNVSKLHIAGLASSGSVHSYIDHLYALLDFAKKEKIEKVNLHVFTDGKDSPPKEGAKFLRMLEERMRKEWPNVEISSVSGRSYAMDRGENWPKTERYFRLLTQGEGKSISSVPAYLSTSYEEGITDEFIEPALVQPSTLNPQPSTLHDGDALIFFNFREDSMRQITRAFTDESFGHFQRKKIENLCVVTMTEYQKDLAALPAFPALDISWPLSRVLSEAGLKHLHLAETQKYAHVTYFFNGGVEIAFPGEEKMLIPSSTSVSFEQTPEMKAAEITSGVLENLGKYDVFIINYANADMVGHSGNFSASVRAIETLDEQIGTLKNAVLANGGIMIITADHGNIELKRSGISGEGLTEHSTSPVPFFLVGKEHKLKSPRSYAEVVKKKSDIGGILTDVAPTIIELLELKKPPEMTGVSLLQILK